jgi:hypothetical protein
MNDSEGLDKEMVVGSGSFSYKAISEAAVLNLIKPLLKKHGLVLFPIETKITESFQEFEGKYGTSQRFMSCLHAKYKIVDIDTGEFEILETVGYGADSQDKGSGKAMTYAYKALLQKTFMLFSGEDTDNEHSDDITKKNSTEYKAPTISETLDYAKKLGVTEQQLIDKYNANMGEKEQITKFIEISDSHRLALYKLLQKQEKAKK